MVCLNVFWYLFHFLFYFDVPADAAQLLKEAREDGYDFITTVLPYTKEPRSDVTTLVGRWWRTSIVGVVPETEKPELMLSRLKPHLEWAIHMEFPLLFCHPPLWKL